MSPFTLVDTHCHLNFHRFDDDRANVLERAAAAGVQRIIVPAIDLKSCREALALCGDYRDLYAAVGIHPNSADDLQRSTLRQLETYASRDSTVAIGEIGLDYYWDKNPRVIQRRMFEAQLELAAEMELPVIVHNREASDDVIDVLEGWASTLPGSIRERPGVLHSFSGTAAHAERALALGFYLGFTGPITFKRADDLRAIARRVPLDRLLIETDAPFLTPHPFRGKRNEPAYVKYVNQTLARLHGLSVEAMARQTTHNAERLFALTPTARLGSDAG